LKPLKETKMYNILKEIELAGRGLTNKELAERIVGVSDYEHPEYHRIASYIHKMEERGFLEKVGYEEDPLTRNHPRRDITERGESFLKLARSGAEYAPKVRT